MSSIATTTVAIRGQLPPRVRGFLLGLSLTILAAVVAATVIAVAIGMANTGRVLPNVHVGDIPLGGLDHAAAQARLAAELPPLNDGVAMVEIGSQRASFTYAEVGRGYDLAAMADAAYGTGRSEGPIGLVVARLRDWISGSSLPVAVHAYDDAAIEPIISRIVASGTTAPIDASVQPVGDGRFIVSPARQGTSVDRSLVHQLLGNALASPVSGDQVVQVRVASSEPAIGTRMAQIAAEMANRMAAGGLRLTAGDDAFTFTQAQVSGLISFQTDAAGTIWPTINDPALQSAIAGLAKQVDRAAKDASYQWGLRISVVPAVEGRSLDQATSGGLVSAALKARAMSSSASGPVQLAVSTIEPKLSTKAAQATVNRVVRISTWTTYYIPGISNGYGANITIPAQALNGQVVAPGATFDFWHDIGPVTFARGYTYGGAIINGKSEHTGALAGGICSTSTTMFNAALRAGLQMGERMNHYYYISRYPVGLDATVFQDVGGVTNMTWTNDTAYPIIIRAITGYGIVRFDLYSVPTGRTVTLTTPRITNRVAAGDTIQYTTSLKPGVQQRLEPIYNGFDSSVTRYVRDRSGKLIHTDTFFSHYHAVNGIVLVGKAAPPTP